MTEKQRKSAEKRETVMNGRPYRSSQSVWTFKCTQKKEKIARITDQVHALVVVSSLLVLWHTANVPESADIQHTHSRTTDPTTIQFFFSHDTFGSSLFNY